MRAQAADHLKQTGGISWRQFEDETRGTVTDYVGVRRTDKGLRLALQTLHALAKREPQLEAGVVIVDSGVILTNLHVVANATKLGLVFADGRGMSTMAKQYTAGQIAATISAERAPQSNPASTAR